MSDSPPTVSLNERPHLSLSASDIQAIPLIHQAIEQDPENSRNQCLLSQALLSTGSLHFAEKAAREAIRLAPDDELGYRLRALVLRAQHRFPDDCLGGEVP